MTRQCTGLGNLSATDARAGDADRRPGTHLGSRCTHRYTRASCGQASRQPMHAQVTAGQACGQPVLGCEMCREVGHPASISANRVGAPWELGT
jgi:hypothetical protein